MEKLWSPWRSQYIDAIKEKHSNNGCFLCEAVNQDVYDMNNFLVHMGNFTFTIINLYPYNNGHLMVVPKRHLSNLTELTEEENKEIMSYLQKAQKALTEVMSPEGFNIGANLGKVSGAGVDDHIHFHIVPRWNGDTNFMPILGEVKIISQDLLLTKEKLLQAYSRLK
ncbi:MAG: HIT family protein [Ignavibacteriaceae bacterium]